MSDRAEQSPSHQLWEVITTLGQLVEARSLEGGAHVERVGELAHRLAQLTGLSEQEAQRLRLAAPLHDVGKLGVPAAILHKPGAVTDAEFAVIQTHTTVGYELLRDARSPVLQAAATVAHEHHERWDGRGYPRALAGEDIHVFGRITALVDVFDALGHRRCYKEAWPTERVLELIRQGRGTAFDPTLVDLFFDHLRDFLDIEDRLPDPV